MPTYKSETVTIVRPAMEGDPEFKAGKDQTIINMPDGTQKTVPTADVKDDKADKAEGEDEEQSDRKHHKAQDKDQEDNDHKHGHKVHA